ncbi:MAG: hypothetical protein BWY91_02037 [bacterium ADurb.BinA028]|nr:MAG: hypothetical protein BWY91_02037 [bacterium ADurb.BinA028]
MGSILEVCSNHVSGLTANSQWRGVGRSVAMSSNLHTVSNCLQI